MLLFSIRKGTLPRQLQGRGDLPPDLQVAICFNVLAVIVLAEPGERFSEEDSQEQPPAFGARSIQMDMPDCEGSLVTMTSLRCSYGGELANAVEDAQTTMDITYFLSYEHLKH